MGRSKFYERISGSDGPTLRRVPIERCRDVAIIVWILVSLGILGVSVYIGIKTKLDCEISPVLWSSGALMLSILLSVVVFISCKSCGKDNCCITCCSVFVTLLVLGSLFATMFFVYKNFDTVSTESDGTNQQNIGSTTPSFSTVTANYSTVTATNYTITAKNSTVTEYYSPDTANHSMISPGPNSNKSSNYCNSSLYYYIFGLVTALLVLIFLCPVCLCCLYSCCC